MAKCVRDAMTRDVRTATPAQSLTDAARMMKSEDAGAIPVEEDGRLVGIITDRDIVVRAVAEGIDPSLLLISDVISRPVVAVTPGQDLDEALELMAQYQVRRLPVVEEDDEVVGILAQADVALNVMEKRAGETLEEIVSREGALVARYSGTGADAMDFPASLVFRGRTLFVTNLAFGHFGGKLSSLGTPFPGAPLRP